MAESDKARDGERQPGGDPGGHRRGPRRRAEEKMTRVILRSIRLSLITSNYSCGSVSYVLITSRITRPAIFDPPRSRSRVSSMRDYAPALKIDHRDHRFARLDLRSFSERSNNPCDRHGCPDRKCVLASSSSSLSLSFSFVIDSRSPRSSSKISSRIAADI